ncbi:MAG: glycine zipper 2TM domain-containing protein [Pseudomonadota bacterium]
MSISSKKIVVGLLAASFTVASAGAFAQDRYDQRGYDQRGYDQNGYDQGRDADRNYDDRDGVYEYARVVDVQPLTTRVRVTTPQRECWDESRYDERGNGNGPMPRTSAGGAVLGAVIGGVLGHQIGHGRGRDAATAAGVVVGAAVGSRQAQRRNGYSSVPPREYTVQRCETRYHDEWQERTDGYRVTYMYNGRRQVTEMQNRPGDRIRVRVDVSPAE